MREPAAAAVAHDGPPSDGDTLTQPTTQFIPDELPFTDDYCSFSTQPTRELVQQARQQRGQMQYPPHSHHHHIHRHHQRAARYVDRLAHRLSRHSLRHQETTRDSGAGQRSSSVSECSPLILPDVPHEGRATAPGITTVDINSRELDGGLAETPESPVTSTGDELRSAPSTTESSAAPTTASTIWEAPEIEPDDNLSEQDVEGTPEPIRDVSYIEVHPDHLLSINQVEMDTDEGFFEEPGSPNPSDSGGGNVEPLGPHRMHGLLRFRRSSQVASNCPVVVHNTPRMRRRRKDKKRRRAATGPDQDTTTDESAARVGAAGGPSHL